MLCLRILPPVYAINWWPLSSVTLEMSPYDLSKGRITFRLIENRMPRAPGAPAFKRKR